MGLGNWTQSGPGISLDSVIKVAGASSLRMSFDYHNYPNSVIRKGFSAKNHRTQFWARRTDASAHPRIVAAYYATLGFDAYMPTNNTWYHFRASFWYDPFTNTKWARMEVEEGGVWSLLVGDIYCGTGDIPPSDLQLQGVAGTISSTTCWFDSLVVEIG